MIFTVIDEKGKVQTVDFKALGGLGGMLLTPLIMLLASSVSDAEVILKFKGALPPEIQKRLNEIYGEGEKE